MSVFINLYLYSGNITSFVIQVIKCIQTHLYFSIKKQELLRKNSKEITFNLKINIFSLGFICFERIIISMLINGD